MSSTETLRTVLQSVLPTFTTDLDNTEVARRLCAAIGERCGLSVLGLLGRETLAAQRHQLCQDFRQHYPKLQKIGAEWSHCFDDQGSCFASLDRLELILKDGEAVSLNPCHCELNDSDAFIDFDASEDTDEAIRLYLIGALGCDRSTTTTQFNAMHDDLIELVAVERDYRYAGYGQIEFDIDLYDAEDVAHD